MNTNELMAFVADKLDDMKGRDIVKLDVKGKSTETDWMIVCSGTSNRHTRSVAAYVITEAKKAGIAVLGTEGDKSGEWVLIDLGQVVVHVMLEESRNFYQLEKLWAA
ncbi:MAG: ribosome silencing factor [Rheinheimera sp.]|nr:ribosome silencing factor [Gammaproteobacteria bacterium]MDZ7902724.1 ribosome silencing factor [Rheinheimera sp.]